MKTVCLWLGAAVHLSNYLWFGCKLLPKIDIQSIMTIKFISLLLSMVAMYPALLQTESENDVFTVQLLQRDVVPLISYFVTNNSQFRQAFNPTWIESSPGTGGKKGLVITTQDCQVNAGQKCVYCSGSAQKAKILAFSEEVSGKFSSINSSNFVFIPNGIEDSWGNGEPRIVYHPKDEMYYMTYQKYDGGGGYLSIAKTKTPLDKDSWERFGRVFPFYQTSKAGALIIRNSAPNYLIWVDTRDLKIAKSINITLWPSIGGILITPRQDKFDSSLVESGPPPLLLSTGDYIFFYNSVEIGWPTLSTASYHVGWLVLKASDPTVVLARSDKPLLSPKYSWERGEAPYSCNRPNVVYVEAAYSLGSNRFKIFYSGADATIGSAIVQVNISKNTINSIYSIHDE